MKKIKFFSILNSKLILTTVLLMLTCYSYAQKIDWNRVDMSADYKRSAKFSGGVIKSLKNDPTFISDYKVIKYVEQKGSNNKGGGASIFSHAQLIGIEEQAFQNMVDDLYAHLKKELESAGLVMANANSVANSETAKSNANGKNEFAGVYPGGGKPDKTAFGDRVENFRPNVPVYFTEGTAGLFYAKLAKKENVNIVMVQYSIQFAGFEQARGYKSKSLTTSPLLVITPIITISTPKGLYSVVTYGKQIFGNNDWSKGVQEASSRDGKALGLSSSADYAIIADQQTYINEVSSIIKAVQKDMVQALRKELL